MAIKLLPADLQEVQNHLYLGSTFAIQPQWSFVRFLVLAEPCRSDIYAWRDDILALS